MPLNPHVFIHVCKRLYAMASLSVPIDVDNDSKKLTEARHSTLLPHVANSTLIPRSQFDLIPHVAITLIPHVAITLIPAPLVGLCLRTLTKQRPLSQVTGVYRVIISHEWSWSAVVFVVSVVV